MQVCSVALRMASPVWEAMLNGNFRESAATSVPLPDDKPSAMLIVLQICHMKYNQLPKGRMNLSELVDLAELCDKYDLVSNVRPWLSTWIEHQVLDGLQVPKLSTAFLKESAFPETLIVAWVFGYEVEFRKTSKALYGRMWKDQAGSLRFSEDQERLRFPACQMLGESNVSLYQEAFFLHTNLTISL